MTEKEWLVSSNPDRMLSFLLDGTEKWQHDNYVGHRKLRLFACAAVRHFWAGLGKGQRESVEFAERFADGLESREELAKLFGRADSYAAEDGPSIDAAWCCNPDVHCSYTSLDTPKEVQADILRDIFSPFFRWELPEEVVRHPSRMSARALEAGAVEEELPHPFLRWNDGTVARLAEKIYQERDWGLVPVLADSLEEAGCTEERVLTHLRGYETCLECLGAGMVNMGLADAQCGSCLFTAERTDAFGDKYWAGCGFIRKRGPCVRGCWVIDVLTGRD